MTTMKKILNWFRGLSWRQAPGLVIGHGIWIFLMFRMGEFGFLVGAIIALLTSPKGLYD